MNADARRAYNRAYYYAHRERRLNAAKAWQVAHPERTRRLNRRFKLRKHYGLTLEAFEWLLEQQGGACATCERDATDVDHDHVTGLPRALLCNRCNLQLGYIEKDPAATRRLLHYLTAHQCP